jgi:hypothetical protein
MEFGERGVEPQTPARAGEQAAGGGGALKAGAGARLLAKPFPGRTFCRLTGKEKTFAPLFQPALAKTLSRFKSDRLLKLRILLCSA